MAILPILQFPDPRLRTVAKPVEKITDELRQQVKDMFETMYEYQGLGLASTQVNIHTRFFVMDISEKRNEPICVINPEIISTEGAQWDYHGCLSVGNHISDKIERAAKLRLRGMDLEGKTFEMDCEGVTAICVQHELDHINGKLFIEHLSRMKQERIRAKLEKIRRQK